MNTEHFSYSCIIALVFTFFNCLLCLLHYITLNSKEKKRYFSVCIFYPLIFGGLKGKCLCLKGVVKTPLKTPISDASRQEKSVNL